MAFWPTAAQAGTENQTQREQGGKTPAHLGWRKVQNTHAGEGVDRTAQAAGKLRVRVLSDLGTGLGMGGGKQMGWYHPKHMGDTKAEAGRDSVPTTPHGRRSGMDQHPKP